MYAMTSSSMAGSISAGSCNSVGDILISVDSLLSLAAVDDAAGVEISPENMSAKYSDAAPRTSL